MTACCATRVRRVSVPSVHYPTPVHLTPAMAEFGAGNGSMPVSEKAAGEILSLPLYPGITVEQQERVADTVHEALRAGSD